MSRRAAAALPAAADMEFFRVSSWSDGREAARKVSPGTKAEKVSMTAFPDRPETMGEGAGR